MFQFAYRGVSGVPRIRLYAVGEGETISKGEPVNLESGVLDAAAAADSAIVGIAHESVKNATEGTVIEVIEADDETVFRVDYIGTTKSSLSDEDIGTAFDLAAADNTKIDLDDTTGGMWVLVGGIDNVAKTCLVKLKSASRAATVG